MCYEPQTCQAKDQETAGENCPVIQTELQQVRIASPDRLKAPLETLMNAREDAISLFLFRMLAPGRFLFHEVHDQCRHQSAGKEVRGEQREYHGLGERHKEIPRYTGEEEHGHEHD